MTVAATCFKWVDLLESQFDKSWTELDSLLLPLEDDEDFSLVYTRSRRHTSSLASCFSQLCHKASVVFQNNAKLEAELLHLREELSSTQATIEQCNKEKLYLAVVRTLTMTCHQCCPDHHHKCLSSPPKTRISAPDCQLRMRG